MSSDEIVVVGSLSEVIKTITKIKPVQAVTLDFQSPLECVCGRERTGLGPWGRHPHPWLGLLPALREASAVQPTESPRGRSRRPCSAALLSVSSHGEHSPSRARSAGRVCPWPRGGALWQGILAEPLLFLFTVLRQGLTRLSRLDSDSWVHSVKGAAHTFPSPKGCSRRILIAAHAEWIPL